MRVPAAVICIDINAEKQRYARDQLVAADRNPTWSSSKGTRATSRGFAGPTRLRPDRSVEGPLHSVLRSRLSQAGGGGHSSPRTMCWQIFRNEPILRRPIHSDAPTASSEGLPASDGDASGRRNRGNDASARRLGSVRNGACRSGPVDAPSSRSRADDGLTRRRSAILSRRAFRDGSHPVRATQRSRLGPDGSRLCSSIRLPRLTSVDKATEADLLRLFCNITLAVSGRTHSSRGIRRLPSRSQSRRHVKRYSLGNPILWRKVSFEDVEGKGPPHDWGGAIGQQEASSSCIRRKVFPDFHDDVPLPSFQFHTSFSTSAR